MAIYVFKMKTFGRNAGSRGSRATSAAAYRAGERIRDVRTGACYDHRRRHDVLHKEIVLPRDLAGRGREMDWARNRATLWNAAERAETRADARVAREFTLALPHELRQPERVRLAQRFANDLVERYRTAVDLVIHAPRGDARNYHAHLLTTTREVTVDGLGRKAPLELSGTERHRRGLARWAEECAWLREHWAGVSNQALRAAGLEVRVSHLPPTTPDLTRPPRLPPVAYHIEQTGRRSFVAERIRAQHRAQLEHSQAQHSQREHAQIQRPALDRPSIERAPGPAAAPLGVAPAGPAASGRHWLERTWARAQAAWFTVRDRLVTHDTFDQSHPAPLVQRAAGEHPATILEHSPVPDHGAARSYRDEAQEKALRDWLEYRQQAAEHAAEHSADNARPDGQHTRGASAGASAGAEPELPPGRGNDYDLSL